MDLSFLRMAVLYWDCIDLPEGILGDNALAWGKTEIDTLCQEGILTRTRGHFFKKEGEQFVLSWSLEHPQEFWTIAQLYALLRHSESNEDWVIGQAGPLLLLPNPQIPKFVFVEPGDNLSSRPARAISLPTGALVLPADRIEVGPTIELKVLHSLPVPTVDVPLEKVLEFKQRRQDELSQLRYTLDALYLQIINSGDIDRATSHAIDTVERALVDLHRAMEQPLIKRFAASFSAKLDVTDIVSHMVTGAIAGGALGSSINLPALGAVLGAAILPAIKIAFDPKALKPRGIPSELKDYAYLYHVEKELR